MDPVTVIRGKLQYRGMIWSLRLLTLAAFQKSTAEFILHSIEEVCHGFLMRQHCKLLYFNVVCCIVLVYAAALLPQLLMPAPA